MSVDTTTAQLRSRWRRIFRGRSYLLSFVAALWLLIILVRLFQIMVLDRDELRRKYHTSSWRRGTVPAIRGRILDQSGMPVAWSVRSFSLSYTPPADVGDLRRDLEALTSRLRTDFDPVLARVQNAREGTSVMLFSHLTATQIIAIHELGNPRFSVVSTFVRQHRPLPAALQRELGSTRVYGQVEVGMSGWEAHYDRQLRGRDGHYLVMVDKAGQWIPETWIEISPPNPGYDVYVTASEP